MKRDPRILYTTAGVLFGLGFPVISTLLDIAVQGMPFSIASIAEVQQTQPLHWVIDTAPLFLGLLSYFVGARQHTVQELNQNLEKKVEMRTEQLQEQNLELKSIHKELEETLSKISQSITYADRIQRAFLKSIEQLKRDLPGSFVYYKPRDVVSGDFPWYVQHNGFTYVAAVDCTGHGVPGAMMSIIGNFLLHRVVHEMGVSDTGAILTELHQQVRETLDQHGVKDVQDGMDLSLARIDTHNRSIQCSGAGNPLYHVAKGELKEVKGDMYSIGGYYRKADPEFRQTEFKYDKGDTLYLFSDGIPDQGDESGSKKFGYKRIKELVSANGTISAETGLTNQLSEWMGSTPQLDDMLVMGIQL